MRILFVTQGGETDPSARVRLLQFRPAFAAALDARTAVVRVVGRSQLATRVGQLRAVLAARRADVVVVGRHPSAKLARGLADANRRTILDLDDAVYTGCPSMDDAFASYERVVVGNRFLAEHVRRFNPAVTVIPSVVDESRYPLAPPPADGPDGWPADRPVRVGWVGHPDNMAELLALQPAFQALAGRAELTVVSSRPFAFGPGGPPVVNKPWRLAEEAADVRSFDVGLMPLADTEWNRHKCAYKALLYMSQSIPAVVSPVGVNGDIIRDGDNGLLATTADEWTNGLARLVADRSLARRIGAAGRQTVRDGFTVAAVLPAWAAVLRGSGQPKT